MATDCDPQSRTGSATTTERRRRGAARLTRGCMEFLMIAPGGRRESGNRFAAIQRVRVTGSNRCIRHIGN